MRKFKAAVNRILILLLAASPVAAGKKSAYLLAEHTNGQMQVIARENTGMMAPVGSLLKPFAALYLLERGFKPDETILCPPERKRSDKLRCWTPAGHGALTLQSALAQSCNYYFLSRFLGLNLGEYETWLRERYDWPANLKIEKPVQVYGFDLASGIEVEKLLGMYSTLIAAVERGDPAARLVLDGLGQTCSGTLADFCRELGKKPRFRFIAGKTGTVVEGRKNFGIVFLYLEHIPDRRKIVLLCYEKNKMGSEAAMGALKILHAYNGQKKR